MNQYEGYMERALELAARGWGRVSPNPMVGAVIVKGGRIIGEGCHEGPGHDHAEVAAIKGAGAGVRGGTLIVNLEPCNHYGRTPPCTEVVIESGIKNVVFGMRDSNPHVSGGGVARLKKEGIKVYGPVLEKECRALNRIYLHWVATRTPYVISKVALSLDGKIATAVGGSRWITNEKCRARMHYWRAGVDAVLVGAGTVRADNPRLNARGLGRGVKQPRPIIVTSRGRISLNQRIWGRQPILVSANGSNLSRFQKIGATVVTAGRDGAMDWKKMLRCLGEMGITSVLVEGGGEIHAEFIKRKLARYMIVSQAPRLIGGEGRDWLPSLDFKKIAATPRIQPDQILVMGDNVVIEGEIFY